MLRRLCKNYIRLFRLPKVVGYNLFWRHSGGAVVFLLCGFMGAGKSSFLKRLSGIDESRKIDLDDYIIDTHRDFSSIAHLIDTKGLDFFRVMEGECLKEALDILIASGQGVLAAGGGVLSDQNVKFISDLGNRLRTVWLDTPLDICLERILSDNTRPLARGGAEALINLYRERRFRYEKCDIHLSYEQQKEICSFDQMVALCV